MSDTHNRHPTSETEPSSKFIDAPPAQMYNHTYEPDAIARSPMNPSATSQQRIAVLRDDFPYASRTFVDRLVESLQADLNVRVLSGEELTVLLSSEPDAIDVLLLPDARFFPAAAMPALLNYLKEWGDLLTVGGPAFNKLMVPQDCRWLDRDGVNEARLATEPTKLLSIEPGVWSALYDQDKTNLITVSSQDAGDMGQAIRFDLPAPQYWCFAAADLQDPFDGGYLTTFWAKSVGESSEAVIEWGESDGSRWFHKFSMDSTWRKYVISADDFRYVPDSPTGRERANWGDRFNPEKAVRLAFGQRKQLTVNPDGATSFLIARIGTATDEFKGIDFTPPILETLSPGEYKPGLPYKCFELSEAARLEPYAGQVVFGEDAKVESPGDLLCPIWRPRGLGYQESNEYRWIPLVSAYDSAGEFRGTPVSMTVNVDDAYPGSTWGFAGFTDPKFLDGNPDYVMGIVRKLLARIESGVFLTSAGTELFCYLTGEPIGVGVKATNGRDKLSRIRTELLRDGRTLIGMDWSSSEDEPIDLQGQLDIDSLKPGYYTVDTTAYVGDRAVDKIRYDFSVVDANRTLGPDVVTVKDGDFYLRDEKWYPIGINFWPLYCSGHEPFQYRIQSWQSPGQYDPEWLDLDLDQAASLGMNSISVQFPGLSAVRSMMDFLQRCRSRGIKVNISVDGHPINGQPERAVELIKEAHLATDDAVYSWDLAWEPNIGQYADRCKLDGKWKRWIEDRYGSVENAEKDWDYKITREDGSVTGPADQQAIEDGPWRVMVAAYRRFNDDLISKGYARSVRMISEVDPHHLFGVRTGFGGTGQPGIASFFPFDLISGIKHLDYTSPEGYGLGGDYINYRRAGLLNLYGRFVSGGKPVFWSEYGVPHYFQGNDWGWSEEAQTAYFANMHRMFMDTDVSGGAGWWWPGGHRVDEDSDFGIINQDRSPRLAAIEYKKVAEKYKDPPPRKPADHWIEIDRDKHVLGLPMVWIGNWDEYIKAWDVGKTAGLKTAGTGTDSSNTPMVAVGNTPLNGHNPPKFLNSEFNWVRIRDARGEWIDVVDGVTIEVEAGRPVVLKASVGNLAESSWLTPNEAGKDNGGVYLCAGVSTLECDTTLCGSRPSTIAMCPLPARTDYLADADFPEFQIPAIDVEADVVIWMVAENRSAFGEKLRFKIKSA